MNSDHSTTSTSVDVPRLLKRCSAMIWRGFHHSQCMRKGTITAANGRAYCKQHDPQKAADREAQRRAQEKAQLELRSLLRIQAEELIHQIGAGTYRGGAEIVLSFAEVSALICMLDKDR